VMYRDYKDTEGLKFPSVVETGAGPGSMPDRMIVERIVLNPPLDARTFSDPAAARKAPRGTEGRLYSPVHPAPNSQSDLPPPWAQGPPPVPAGTPQSSPQPASAPPEAPRPQSQDPGPGGR